MRKLRRVVEVPLGPYRALSTAERSVPASSTVENAEADVWNHLVDQGWIARWRPLGHHRRRAWFWVRRSGHELLVFPGSERRPRDGNDAQFRVNGNLVYRAFDHPERTLLRALVCHSQRKGLSG